MRLRLRATARPCRPAQPPFWLLHVVTHRDMRQPERGAVAVERGGRGHSYTPAVLVLVPVKAFGRAKVRLAEVLDAPARAALAREMADRVLTAAAPVPVAVVCDDEEVAAWAESRGARVLWRPGHGLNGAVTDAVATLAGEGVDRVLVTHADLPLATGYDELAVEGVVLVPDRHEDGTNVVSIPADCGFTFAYGPGSFARHCAEAERLGLALTVHRPRRLTWDVDVPADLDLPPDLPTAPLLCR